MGGISRLLTGADRDSDRRSPVDNDNKNTDAFPASLRAGWRGVRGFPRAVTRRMTTSNSGERNSASPTPGAVLSDAVFEPSATAFVVRYPSPTNDPPAGYTVKRKPLARPQPSPLQMPPHDFAGAKGQVCSFQQEVVVKRATLWCKALRYNRLTSMLSTRSNESAWTPAQGRPHGCNSFSEYRSKPASKTKPNYPRGNTPEPLLPDPKLILSDRRSSAATATTSISLVPTPTEAYGNAFDAVSLASTVLTEPFPELDVSPHLPVLAFQPNHSLTFEAILAQRQAHFGNPEPMHTSSLQSQKGKTTLPDPAYQPLRTPSPVPTLLRPHVPFFLGEPDRHSYEAFNPDVHVVDINRAVRNDQGTHYSSLVQLNMIKEMHFEHSQETRHTLPYLTRGTQRYSPAPAAPQPDYLCTASILDPPSDLSTELNHVADKVLGKSTNSENSCPTGNTTPRRKPLPSTFLLPPTPTKEVFDSDKFPLLETAARSLDNGLLGLTRPLPLGYTSQNGSEPMIARPRPVGCADGWVRREVDPARELFEQNKQKKLQKRKKDVAEWLRGEEKGESSVNGP